MTNTVPAEWRQAALQVPETFGSRLRKARKEAGLTQKEIAKLAGRSVLYLSKIELGQSRPEEKYLRRLKRCEVLWNAYAKHAPDEKWQRALNRLDEARARLEPFARAVNSTVEALLGQAPPEENSQSSAGQVDSGVVE